MKLLELLRVTPGRRHGVYQTSKGFDCRKPLGQDVDKPSRDKESLFIMMSIGIVVALLWAFVIAKGFEMRETYLYIMKEAKAETNEITLNVEVLEGEIVRETDDSIMIFAPAKFKVVRAAYGDSCYYNLANSLTYGAGEDVIYANEEFTYTYKVVCQSLIGNKVTAKSKTVTVLPENVREVALSSR